MLTATLSDLAAPLARLEAALEHQLDAALGLISARVADEAKASHPFQNRTGDLEASIRPLDTSGSALDGTLAGGVIAEEDYASFVEAAGFAFLDPAYERVAPETDRLLEQALSEAARAAGW